MRIRVVRSAESLPAGVPRSGTKVGDPEKAMAGLRRALGGLARRGGRADVVSRRSAQKTIEVFGAPLTVREVVSRIIADVRADGDAAVARYTRKLDDVSLRPSGFRVPKETIEAAPASVSQELMKTLTTAAKRIREFQQLIKKDSAEPKITAEGAVLEVRYRPLKRVAVHVPGWAAAYPSSVLMCVVPARVAGVPQIAMCTPPQRNGAVAPAVLAAANLVGVDEVYQIGGAQAIAALALGTETIPRVDKIVGPGNAFVTEAKRQLFGEVGIDILAGPSEVVIIADDTAPADYVAADMLSQAEHDPGCAVLITTSDKLVKKVQASLDVQLTDLDRWETAQAALERYGLIVVTQTLDEAAQLADFFAPEHLEVITKQPRVLASKISNAGAIFLGPNTPEAVGDYIAGPSHVLPTGGAARFQSGLSVRDFIKGTSIVSYTREALKSVADDVVRIAEVEGLSAHVSSILARFQARPKP